MGKTPGSGSDTIPDARWINRELDIVLVAKALAIRRSGARFHCWHPENHRNRDADPSVGHWRAANRLNCFVCGKASVSVIDLVMEVRHEDFTAAISWIASNFDVSRIQVRKPELGVRRHLDGVTHPIDYLVRTHIFGQLSLPAQTVATAMVAFSDHEGPAHKPWTVTISYRGLMRYSGIRSPNSISKAIKELQIIGWLQKHGGRVGVLRTTGAYTITPFSEKIEELGNKLAREEQMAIEYERAAAERRRIRRQMTFRAKSKGRGAAA